MKKSYFSWLILTALAVVFSQFSIQVLPQGGAISIDALFLFLILFSFGFRKFTYSVGIYILFDIIFGTTFISPVQWLFDYPLPIFSLGLGYLLLWKFKSSTTKEVAVITIGFFIKYLCHCFSGYVFFGEYAPEGVSVVWYTISYNFLYNLPSYVAVVIIFIALKKLKIAYFANN